MNKRKRCIHNINKDNNTIIMLEGFKTMVTPEVLHGVCKVCGRPFEFEADKLRKEEVFDNVDGRGNKG